MQIRVSEPLLPSSHRHRRMLGVAARHVRGASAERDSCPRWWFPEPTIQEQSATTQAPTLTPLDVSQPTSAISQYFIQNNMPATSNYSDIIAISPSVQSIQPNGPGLMENQSLSIRGFQDGFFNVTFDGIPWNDSNDFTHHSTSYFMDNDLGGVAVDRGPGTAATIGNATFGGTISNVSKAPLQDMTLTPSVTYGSFGTSVVGAEFDTGTISKWGGAAGYIDAESLSSDGELSNSGLDRKNHLRQIRGAARWHRRAHLRGDVQPAPPERRRRRHGRRDRRRTGRRTCCPPIRTARTISATTSTASTRTSSTSDSTSQLGGGWTLNNKVYTYGYWHMGHAGEDPNGPTPNGTPYGADDVPGTLLTNDYRSWGDTLNLQDDFSFGDLKTGAWIDRQSNLRGLANTDETLNDAFVESVPGSSRLGVLRRSAPEPGAGDAAGIRAVRLEPGFAVSPCHRVCATFPSIAKSTRPSTSRPAIRSTTTTPSTRRCLRCWRTT